MQKVTYTVALVLASLLDPRFKDKFLVENMRRLKLKSCLMRKYVAENTSTDERRVPSPKTSKNTLVTKVFCNILEEYILQNL